MAANQDYKRLEPDAAAPGSVPDAKASNFQLRLLFTGKNLTIAIWMSLVLLLAVANRVISKITLVPMGPYAYFISQFNAFCYCVIYFAFIGYRYWKGLITPAMLAYPKKLFIIMGLMDSAGSLLGNIGTAKVNGSLLPLLAQFIVPFSMVATICILKARYSLGQYLSAGLIIVGAVTALVPTFQSMSIALFYSLLYISSTAPSAISFALKEYVFKDKQYFERHVEKQRNVSLSTVATSGTATDDQYSTLQGGDNQSDQKQSDSAGRSDNSSDSAAEVDNPEELIRNPSRITAFDPVKAAVQQENLKMDIFIVNGYDSMFQFLWTLLLLPVVSIPYFGPKNTAIDGRVKYYIPLEDLFEYFLQGWRCFVGINSMETDDCSGDPWLPLMYIAINISWNICIAQLVKHGGSLVMFIAIKLSIPFCNIAFFIHWPRLQPDPFSWWVLASLFIVMIGVVLYRIYTVKKEVNDKVILKQQLQAKAEMSASQARPKDGSDV